MSCETSCGSGTGRVELAGWFVPMVLVLSAATGFAVAQWGSPFEVPEEIAMIGPTAPTDQLELQTRTQIEVTRRNAAASLAMAGGLLCLVAGFGSAVRRVSAGKAALLGVVGASWGVLLGLAGGYLADILLARLDQLPPPPDPNKLNIQMLSSIFVHGCEWVAVGLAFGLAVAMGLRRDWIKLAAGTGLLGGILSAIVYLPVAAMLFPLKPSDRTTPQGLGNVVCWVLVAGLVLSLFCWLLAGPQKVALAGAEPTPAPGGG